MRHLVFAVLDVKAGAYLKPFFVPTVAVAERSFASACREEGHDFNRFCLDYYLYNLGAFDDGTGVLTALDQPLQVAWAKDFALNSEVVS